jgi:hypothetical protein
MRFNPVKSKTPEQKHNKVRKTFAKVNKSIGQTKFELNNGFYEGDS